MLLTLPDSTALDLAAQILANVRERAEALAQAAAAQRAINNNAGAAPGTQTSLIQFPLQDAEQLADAVAKAGKLCAEKTIDF